MGSDAWIQGDVCRPLIEVLNPDTDVPVATAAPDVVFIEPDGTRVSVEAFADEAIALAWDVEYELLQIGRYTLIVESPAPYKDVQTATLYVNPPG